MGRGQPPDEPRCGACGELLAAPREAGVARGTVCLCRGEVEGNSRSRSSEPPAVEGLELIARGWALRGIRGVYHAGVVVGGAAMFAVGGFVPVIHGWLSDEVTTWGEVLEALGGVQLVAETKDPDGDLGPVLGRLDAPVLFGAIADVARKLGVRPPGQVRLTYLPCCGVLAWGRRSRALVLGLPLLHVLTLAELRAVLAHELAHLAWGDATRAARSSRFIEALGRALERQRGRRRGPLRWWAARCHRLGGALLAPIARGQEVRADRAAAAISGGDATASALVKVAIVQPLFREVLDHYDPDTPGLPNLYAFFRAFWARLPESSRIAMRHTLLSKRAAGDSGAHPPLLDRLSVVQAYRDRSTSDSELAASSNVLGDLEGFEYMLHTRLFDAPAIEPSVFHRAGS